MKKYLFLICLLFPLSLRAETFVDALGAECSRVLYGLSGYDYPDRFDIMLKRNKQFDFLQTCLQLYKENGGKIDILNDRYDRARGLYHISIQGCFSNEETKEENKDKCAEKANMVMEQTFLGKECELKMFGDPYYINKALDSICKNN